MMRFIAMILVARDAASAARRGDVDTAQRIIAAG